MSDATISRQLMLTAIPGIPTVKSGDDLAPMILTAARNANMPLCRDDIVVIAQKIVSKAEGRSVRLSEVTPSERALSLATEVGKDPRLIELILRESTEVVRSRPGVIIVAHTLGHVMANAGIDASNVELIDGDETVLLLPSDPDVSAERIRAAILAQANVEVGVVINDSFGRAWRMGTVGAAIGVAGLPGLLDMRGRADRNGRALRTTEVGIADELAAAGSLLMGQAAEGQPVVLIRGYVRPRRDGSAAELIRPRHLDLFR
jgi:coenzyme F420-0:L-glutamate ligase/coenzyme F420-1:gamma-L-glutamate ligase